MGNESVDAHMLSYVRGTMMQYIDMNVEHGAMSEWEIDLLRRRVLFVKSTVMRQVDGYR